MRSLLRVRVSGVCVFCRSARLTFFSAASVLCRLLLRQPDLLLLDEPTNHLDLSAQIAVMEILRALADEGLTILVTMHDLNLTAAWFDHVVALDRGRVAAQGAPQHVIDSAFLARVYGVAAAIVPNPASGRPMIAYGP